MGRIGVLHGDWHSFNIPWHKKLWIRGFTPSMASWDNGYCLSEGGGTSLVRRLIGFLDFRSPASVGSHPQTWGGSFCSSCSRVKSLGLSCNGATNLDKLLIGLWIRMPWGEQCKFACTLQSKGLPKKFVRLFASSIKECVMDRGLTWRGISSEQGTCWGLQFP